MVQANFAYAAPANDAVGVPLAVSVFADRAHVRDQVCEDIALAGFRLAEVGELALLVDADEMCRPSDVVLVDCPRIDGATLAALARLDVRAAHGGTQVVVATEIDSLDDVFGCLDRCGAQILVAPSRAERVIALGRVLINLPAAGVRDLSDEERLTLLRLTEQLEQIAARIDRLSPAARPGPIDEDEAAFRFESPRRSFAGSGEDASARLVRAVRPPLPDPRLVRRIIRQRQARAKFFDGALFADPAWDMLLDLTAARVEHVRVSVSSLCIAAGVPPTTALRWIGQMIEAGLLERIEDEIDRRRTFITLTDKAADAMAHYFAELGRGASRLV